jgi:hypothetical protein
MRQWKEVIADWAGELSERLGRPKEDLLVSGLCANDFSPTRCVEIRFADGSLARFKFAFAIVSEAKNHVAIFTEHCGYFEIPLAPDMEVVQINEDYYRHETMAF